MRKEFVVVRIDAAPDAAPYVVVSLSSKKDVQENDLVVLDDPAWSISGNGLVLGIVTSITPLDEAPLRKIVTVTPRQRAREHAGVVVLGTGDGESQ